jgi:hypothetical protein
MTTLKELEKRHDEAASAKVRRLLNNYHWQVNANDVLWMYHEPEVEKQLGRSARVYNRLMNLEYEKENR